MKLKNALTVGGEKLDISSQLLNFAEYWSDAEELLLSLQLKGNTANAILNQVEQEGRGDTDVGFRTQIQLKALRASNDNFALPLWTKLMDPVRI